MITHCPECGEELHIYQEDKVLGFYLECNNIDYYFPHSFTHYYEYFRGENIFYKLRMLKIDGKLYRFHSDARRSRTTISSFDDEFTDTLIYDHPEALMEVDEISFVKKILKMKAFL